MESLDAAVSFVLTDPILVVWLLVLSSILVRDVWVLTIAISEFRGGSASLAPAPCALLLFDPDESGRETDMPKLITISDTKIMGLTILRMYCTRTDLSS